MCRPTLTQGNAYNTVKTVACRSSQLLWSYLKIKLGERGGIFHCYTCNKRSGVLKYGLLYKSISEAKKWEHVRFETQDHFVGLQKLIGNENFFGVKKSRSSKRLNYESILHVNDTCHVTRPLTEPTHFTIRTLSETEINFLFIEVDGMEVWVRYSSIRASLHPEINNVLSESMETRVPVHSVRGIDATLEDVRIVPGRTIFNHDHTIFRVTEVNENIVFAKSFTNSKQRTVPAQSNCLV